MRRGEHGSGKLRGDEDAGRMAGGEVVGEARKSRGTAAWRAPPENGDDHRAVKKPETRAIRAGRAEDEGAKNGGERDRTGDREYLKLDMRYHMRLERGAETRDRPDVDVLGAKADSVWRRTQKTSRVV